MILSGGADRNIGDSFSDTWQLLIDAKFLSEERESVCSPLKLVMINE